VEARGAGPDVVVLPAAQGSRRWFLPTFTPLAGSYRVLGYSLRGERGDGSPDGLSLEDLVDDLEEAMRVAGAESASLVGSSLGGIIALAFALRHPRRVRALVLHATCARLRDHGGFAALSRGLLGGSPLLAGWAFHAYAAWLCLPELLAMPLPRAVPALRRFAGTALRHASPAAALARRLELLARVDLEPRVPEVGCPVLLLSGEDRLDRLMPRRSRASLESALRHAERAVVPGTGHHGFITAPAEARALVAAFLDRHLRSTA
jgi:pimeloyl-ACP methyl ester carboxylesterase